MTLEMLSEYCIQSLVRNKEQFPVIGNMPFRLLKDYLKRINVNVHQLMRYEKYNVEWIFDDDEMWIDFLKMDFPTNIHEQYVNNRDKIIKYYKESLRSMNNLNLDASHGVTVVMLRSRISQVIKRDPKTHKYKVPYRMLYLQYQDDIKLKEAQVAENLRLQMQKIKEERDKKSTVAVGEKFFIDNITSKRKRHGGVTPVWQPVHKKEPIEVSKRRHVERVAFGGMAGRKVNPDAFKIVSRDPPPRIPSPVKQIEQKERRSRSPPLITTPRKQPRNSSGPNIFLNRRPRPLHRSPNKKDNNRSSHISTHEEPSSTNNSNPGTKKKASSIFSTQKQTQPYACNNNPDKPSSKPSRTTSPIINPHSSTTPTVTTAKATNKSENTAINGDSAEQRVHSLSFYLQKRQSTKTPKK